VFEQVLERCGRERLVGGEGSAIDASLVKVDACLHSSTSSQLMMRTSSMATKTRTERAVEARADGQCARQRMTGTGIDMPERQSRNGELPEGATRLTNPSLALA
jgi:hypothetical protein